jgi:hypothetical protein
MSPSDTIAIPSKLAAEIRPLRTTPLKSIRNDKILKILTALFNVRDHWHIHELVDLLGLPKTYIRGFLTILVRRRTIKNVSAPMESVENWCYWAYTAVPRLPENISKNARKKSQTQTVDDRIVQGKIELSPDEITACGKPGRVVWAHFDPVTQRLTAVFNDKDRLRCAPKVQSRYLTSPRCSHLLIVRYLKHELDKWLAEVGEGRFLAGYRDGKHFIIRSKLHKSWFTHRGLNNSFGYAEEDETDVYRLNLIRRSRGTPAHRTRLRLIMETLPPQLLQRVHRLNDSTKSDEYRALTVALCRLSPRMVADLMILMNRRTEFLQERCFAHLLADRKIEPIFPFLRDSHLLQVYQICKG